MIGGTRDAAVFFFFFSSIFHSRLHFYLGMLQAQLLVSSYSTFSKKRRRESSVCGPFVVFAALAVTQRKDIEDIVNVSEIWWFLKLFFICSILSLLFFQHVISAVVLSHFVEALLTLAWLSLACRVFNTPSPLLALPFHTRMNGFDLMHTALPYVYYLLPPWMCLCMCAFLLLLISLWVHLHRSAHNPIGGKRCGKLVCLAVLLVWQIVLCFKCF